MAAAPILNIVAAVAFVGVLGVQGLGLAYAVAYSVGAVLALAALRRRVHGFGGRHTVDGIGRMVVAAGIMAIAVWGVTEVVGSDEGSGAVARTLTGVLVGIAVYLVAVVALRVPDAMDLLLRLRQRRRPPAPATP